MANKLPDHPERILPEGTQVVIRIERTGKQDSYRRGSVGTIVKTPADNRQPYLVSFPDGRQATFHKSELAIRKSFQEQSLGQPAAHAELEQYVIYRCIVGSRAFGLDDHDSDTDRRGIYLPPAALHWSLNGVPEQIENKNNEECYWELQKFLILALKANPNVLECLYTPLTETVTPLAQELLDMRSVFLSRLIYQTYNSYVLSQFKKLDNMLQNEKQIKWKHAMHLLRLLLSGIAILKEGFVAVRVTEFKEQLLAVKQQQLSWQEVNQWRLGLHSEFDRAYENTVLPDLPDYQQVNRFLVRARKSMS